MSTLVPEPINKIEIYRSRIAEIIPQLMADEEVYQEEFDLDEIIDYVTGVMSRVPLAKLDAIEDGDLKGRVDRLMALKLVSGMLNDLSPEEMKMFDDAVARR